MISFAIFIIAIGLLWLGLSAYRSYVFNHYTPSELLEKIRAHRRIYSYMTQQQRNSRYGKGVYKSIILMEARLKTLANVVS